MRRTRFRWVFCQLDALRHCLPSSVRRTIEELPESLDETYERIVMGIKKGNQAHAYRMLQCLTVAIRPLSVEELAELLAFDFRVAKDGIPRLNADWRWQDHEQAVLSICSSLITVVWADDSRVVQFSHFLVKEFLMSDRVAMSTNDISQYHIVLGCANTVVACACLGVLLQDAVDQDAADNVSLVRYAAEHWVAHAQIENVAPCIRDGMQRLFDPNKPYLSAWVRLHDVDYRLNPDGLKSKRQPEAAPLYYAACCGFNEIVTILTLERLQYASAIGGGCGTAMHAASIRGHVQVIRSLLQCGVNVDVRGGAYGARHHFASRGGYVGVVQCLLDHGANANLRDKYGFTPLTLANACGHPDVVQVLLDHHSDVNPLDTDDRTPLDNVGPVNLSEEWNIDRSMVRIRMAVCLVSSLQPEVARILLEYGIGVDAEDKEGRTPSLVGGIGGRP